MVGYSNRLSLYIVFILFMTGLLVGVLPNGNSSAGKAQHTPPAQRSAKKSASIISDGLTGGALARVPPRRSRVGVIIYLRRLVASNEPASTDRGLRDEGAGEQSTDSPASRSTRPGKVAVRVSIQGDCCFSPPST